MQKLPAIVFGIGFTILLCAGLTGLFIIPSVYNYKIAQEVQLANGSEMFKRWQDPAPVYVRLHLFNVTNPEDVSVGMKPILEQIGPYVYRQTGTKVDISISQENDTVTYRQPVMYFFEPELSNGTEKDYVTILNLPYVGTLSKAARQTAILRSVVLQYVQQFENTLFVTKTIEEVLFKGYYMEMMESLSELLGYQVLPNNTFGLFYGKNGSDLGEYEVFSGVSDSSLLGEIANWNSSPDMPWWSEEQCKKIRGSDGFTFPPLITTDQVIDVFNPDLCRSFTLLYDGMVEHHGVPGYRFVTSQAELDDPRENSDNMCYCTQPGYNDTNCPKRGAYQVNACRQDIPLLVSLPHFLDASKEYLNATVGLHPVRELHETFIDVEPNTGLLLKASKRIQMNIELRPYKFMKQFKKVPHMLFPIIWGDETVEMSEAEAVALTSQLNEILPLKSFAQHISWTACAIGFAIVAFAIIIALLRARKKSYLT